MLVNIGGKTSDENGDELSYPESKEDFVNMINNHGLESFFKASRRLRRIISFDDGKETFVLDDGDMLTLALAKFELWSLQGGLNEKAENEICDFLRIRRMERENRKHK